MLKKILLIAFAYLIYSCNSSTEQQKIQESSKVDSTHIFDTISSLSKDTLSKKEVTTLIKIDSSKLVKGFDDIYFGIPSGQLKNKEYYSIGECGLELTSSNYDNTFGLFEFELTSTREFKESDVENFKNCVFSIINLKYGTPKKTERVVKIDDAEKLFREISEENNNEDEAKSPKDWGDIIYKYTWSKSSVNIHLRYKILYKPVFYKVKAIDLTREGAEYQNVDSKKIKTFIKYYKPLLKFEYPPFNVEEKNYEKKKIKKDVDKL